MTKKIKEIIGITLFIVIYILVLVAVNNYEKAELITRKGVTYEKAIVTEIVKDNIIEDGSRVGYQTVKLKLLSGDNKGEVIEASSNSGFLYGADCTPNMKVVVSISISGDNYNASVYSYDRANIIYLFTIIFFILLGIVGGKKGIKSVIGLIFTFSTILFLFIPMIYRGYSAILAAIICIILISVISLYLIDGFSKKSICAMIGTIIGVIIAGISACIFGKIAKVSSYNLTEIEELILVSDSTKLNISGILFGGILIAALGAVIDVAMSISSTINEIHEKNPNLSRIELFKSGINVGRDMMGTMSNTLILAFTGGSITTLILVHAYNLNYNQVINRYDIAIEIMQGISGSIGVILTVPIVAFISSLLIKRNKA